MFFDLLKNIFHLDDDDLHLGLIAFAAESIDFAAHFLCHKTELLSYASLRTICFAVFTHSAFRVPHALAEIADMPVPDGSCR